jgi:WD40 repeat protein
VRIAVPLLLVACVACEHSRPFDASGRAPLGPFSSGTPRQLTFNPGDDRAPAWSSGQIVFARQSPAEEGREACLAFLPEAGGTLTGLRCPVPQTTERDSFVDTWFDPAPSADGRRVAFLWQKGARVSALTFESTVLVVSQAVHPADSVEFRWQVIYDAPDGRPANTVAQISWVDGHTLRVAATYEQIIKVKGGGALRFTDTSFVALWLLDVDLRTGAVREVPGGDSVVVYTRAPDGGVWMVHQSDSTALLHLDPATGARTLVGRFSRAVTALANVDGVPVAIVQPDTLIERLNVATGASQPLVSLALPARRLAAVPGRRVVVEVEQGIDQFGMPADLWLFVVP